MSYAGLVVYSIILCGLCIHTFRYLCVCQFVSYVLKMCICVRFCWRNKLLRSLPPLPRNSVCLDTFQTHQETLNILIIIIIIIVIIVIVVMIMRIIKTMLMTTTMRVVIMAVLMMMVVVRKLRNTT